MYPPRQPVPEREEIKSVSLALAFLLFIGALAAFLSGCAPHHVKVQAPTEVDKQTYGYREVKPDTFIVWVKDNNEAPAKEEICTKTYVCTIEPAGRVIVIERTRK